MKGGRGHIFPYRRVPAGVFVVVTILLKAFLGISEYMVGRVSDG